MPLITPSILSADFARLGEAIVELNRSGADWVHVDVMDGHFVPNLTIGPPVVAALKPLSRLPLDCHLMISNPDRYLEEYARVGADWLSVHVEACVHLQRTLARIRELGMKAGAALNPHTPPEVLEYVLADLDYVLVMSVNPGFGGQKFLGSQVAKVARLARMRAEAGAHYLIQVDGGVTDRTAPLVGAAGADALVSGSWLFGHPEGLATGVARLRAAAGG